MENNETQPKKSSSTTIILIILCLLVAGGACYWYLTQNNGTDNNAVDNTGTEDNSPKTNLTTDYVSIENENYTKNKNKQYVNYTSFDDVRTSNPDKKMKIVVQDGKIIPTIDGTELKVNGIEGKVKSFVYGTECGGTQYILLITEDNRLFYDTTMPSNTRRLVDETFVFEFKEVKIADVVNITKIVFAGQRTCGYYDFAVVLSSGEIKPIKELSSSTIGSFDYRKIKNMIYPVVIYDDNTMSSLMDDGYNGQVPEKIKYNGKELIVTRLIDINLDSQLVGGNVSSYDKYVISENKLYKVTTKFEGGSITGTLNVSVELMNESAIANETFERSAKTDTIEFQDGNTIKLENVDEIYG